MQRKKYLKDKVVEKLDILGLVEEFLIMTPETQKAKIIDKGGGFIKSKIYSLKTLIKNI